MHRPIATITCCLLVAAVAASSAAAHGNTGTDFRSKILSIEPAGLPVDVRIVDGDQVRFENKGDRELVLCGYEQVDDGCEEWVRLGPDGVFVDQAARSYFANVDEEAYGDIPEDAGTESDWTRIRERPAFYTYHDHRVHWMGLSLPPSVDPGDDSPQKVFDAELAFRYGDTDGTVATRLEYVGGASWVRRHGEQLLVGGGVLVMLVVFGLDARRRRSDAQVD